MATIASRGAEAKPKPVLYALVLSVINGLGGLLFCAIWPDLDDRGTVIVGSLIFAVLMIGFAAWMWAGSRWGGWGTIAVNVISILASIPAYFAGDAGLEIGGTISLVLSALTIWFVWTPEARAFWRGS